MPRHIFIQVHGRIQDADHQALAVLQQRVQRRALRLGPGPVAPAVGRFRLLALLKGFAPLLPRRLEQRLRSALQLPLQLLEGRPLACPPPAPGPKPPGAGPPA